MLDTFSRKQFIIDQLRGKLGPDPDTPKFKERKEKGLATLPIAENTINFHVNRPLT
jgi:hypothetical protein